MQQPAQEAARARFRVQGEHPRDDGRKQYPRRSHGHAAQRRLAPRGTETHADQGEGARKHRGEHHHGGDARHQRQHEAPGGLDGEQRVDHHERTEAAQADRDVLDFLAEIRHRERQARERREHERAGDRGLALAEVAAALAYQQHAVGAEHEHHARQECDQCRRARRESPEEVQCEEPDARRRAEQLEPQRVVAAQHVFDEKRDRERKECRGSEDRAPEQRLARRPPEAAHEEQHGERAEQEQLRARGGISSALDPDESEIRDATCGAEPRDCDVDMGRVDHPVSFAMKRRTRARTTNALTGSRGRSTFIAHGLKK